MALLLLWQLKTCHKLLELATLDNYFFFNGSIYRQTDRAMGSPLGPHLANIFMCYMEKRWSQDCPAEFKPILYRRYVDDTFLLFKCNSENQKLVIAYYPNRERRLIFIFVL